MISVSKKDSRESAENLMRRFNRKVAQSGVLAAAKTNQFFAKGMSKRERRRRAIINTERRAARVKKLRLSR